MYCSECGSEATGKFCWSCGRPLRQGSSARPSSPPAAAALQVPPPPVHWSLTTDYETLIQTPEVRDRIARHAARSASRVSAEQFLECCDKVFSPLTGGVSLLTIAAISQPLGAKLGLKTCKTRVERYSQPPGEMIVAILCSLAENGLTLLDAQQGSQSCLLRANLPSDIFSYRGELVFEVRVEEQGVVVEAGVTIPGQLYDWGKSRRCLDRLFSHIVTLAKCA